MSLKKEQSGLSLVESVVTIGIAAVIVVIIGLTTVLLSIDRGSKYRSWATSLVQEEIEVVSSQPFDSLTNQTNSVFSWVPYNYGSWQVSSAVAAVSSPKVYELQSGLALTNLISGLSMAPISQAISATMQSSVKVNSDSPPNWRAGIAFGVVDHKNYYRLRFSSTNLLLEKITNGTAATLYTLTQAFSYNTWYTLKIVTTSADIQIWLDGILKNTYTGAFTGGEFGLIGLSGVHAYFDNVSVTTSSTSSWNFDTDTAGSMPNSWSRFGIYDIPNSTSQLTIATYNGDANTKQITATILYPESQGTKNITFTALKSKY